jgi:hypothetical protein
LSIQALLFFPHYWRLKTYKIISFANSKFSISISGEILPVKKTQKGPAPRVCPKENGPEASLAASRARPFRPSFGTKPFVSGVKEKGSSWRWCPAPVPSALQNLAQFHFPTSPSSPAFVSIAVELFDLQFLC